MNDPLELIDTWPVDIVAAGVVDVDGRVASRGPTDHMFRLASISKVITGWAALIAVEEGSISLDDAVGQPGCTVRHLLSHAGGYAFTGPEPISRPESRRIYSNTGIEMVAAHIERATGFGFSDYLTEAIFAPLGMASTSLRGSAAWAIHSTIDDLVCFVRELQSPRLLDAATAADQRSVQFPDLAGLVPGVGTFRPCPWGLGCEIHGSKQPHWMSSTNSPETYGHFGGSGTMLWVDPIAGTSLIALTNRDFDAWSTDAVRLWSELSDVVLSRRRSDR